MAPKYVSTHCIYQFIQNSEYVGDKAAVLEPVQWHIGQSVLKTDIQSLSLAGNVACNTRQIGN